MNTLNHRVAIYVPYHEEGQWLYSIQEHFTEAFGGCTTTIADGRWRGPDGKVQRENLWIVEAYFNDGTAGYAIAHKLAKSMGHDLQQETVAFVVDGVMYLEDCR